ncbi:MAG: class I SAM-dependent methyltransferase [Alistipes sp.]
MKTYGDTTITYTPESLPPILKWVTPNARVLEFGPAYGYMTRYLREVLHCCITCVELNPDMETPLQRYAERVIIANLDSDAWTSQVEGRFDYILFADVLEHLRDPRHTMEQASRFGDCVIVSVPNIGHASIQLSLLEGRFEYQNLGLLDNTHIHFFTRTSLEALMNSCSMECTKEQDNICHYPFSCELHTCYGQHLMAAVSIARAPDSSVYQFRSQWRRIAEPAKIRKSQPIRLSFLKANRVILLESIRYFLLKAHLQNTWLTKLWLKIR